MKQPKDTPEAPVSSPRYRYWTSPPETVTVPVAVLEAVIPAASRLARFEDGQTVALPAREVFSSNVPRIRLSRLAELLPAHVAPGDESIALPVAPLAVAYTLVGHSEELPEEKPEPVAEVAAPAGPVIEGKPVVEGDPVIAEHPGVEQAPPVESVVESAAPPVESPVCVREVPPAPVMPAVPEAPQVPTPEKLKVVVPKPVASSLPPRRPGILQGLPIFRRNPAAAPQPSIAPVPEIPAPQEAAPEPVPESEQLPAKELLSEPVAPEVPAAIEEIPPAAEETVAVEEPVLPVVVDGPVAAAVHEEAVPEVAEMEPAPVAIRMLETEHLVERAATTELADEDAMQALFLTEEKLSVARVIELCGDLPGINSCVLAHGSVIVASHNAPSHVDLVSLSAHAETMLNAMRDSSARMGVGTVPAVTLHTEKGVISFFNREDLTMLVFHKDRGFVPGVREKMAAVLGELSKARIALPAGGSGPGGA